MIVLDRLGPTNLPEGSTDPGSPIANRTFNGTSIFRLVLIVRVDDEFCSRQGSLEIQRTIFPVSS